MYALTSYSAVNMYSSLKETLNIAWTPAATTDHIPIIALPCSHPNSINICNHIVHMASKDHLICS